jgi:N-methylhydantoinase B
VIPEGKNEPVIWRGKLARHPLKQGDIVRLITGKGGGYGDPKERDPASVREDVMNGFVTLEDSRKIYGVELDPDSLEIDQRKTDILRKGPYYV